MIELLGNNLPKLKKPNYKPNKVRTGIMQDSEKSIAYWREQLAKNPGDPVAIQQINNYIALQKQTNTNFNTNWFPNKNGKMVGNKKKTADGENINGIGFDPSIVVWGLTGLAVAYAIFKGR